MVQLSITIISGVFKQSIKLVLNTLSEDFRVIFDKDPAARNWIEVLFCYPGLQALWLYRLAHWLHRLDIAFIPRLISQFARFLTGIEIHPGAVIGKGAFIDHGMGVVIGETTIVGEYVLLYQGVTLGGNGKEAGKRHPTLGDNVVVGAGAKVLGNIQVGSNVRIGAGSVVLKDVPPDCTVVGVPGRVVHRHGEVVAPLDHCRVPDPEGDVIRSLISRVEKLEHRLQEQELQRTANTFIVDCSLLKDVRPKHLNGSQTGSEIEDFEESPSLQYEGFMEGAGI